MRDADEVARESLGNIAGPMRRIFRDAAWLDALDVLIAQEAEHLADLIRARDAEVRAEALAGLTYESCGTNRLGQPTGRWVGPVEVEP